MPNAGTATRRRSRFRCRSNRRPFARTGTAVSELRLFRNSRVLRDEKQIPQVIENMQYDSRIPFSGPGGRRFKSSLPDHYPEANHCISVDPVFGISTTWVHLGPIS